MDVHFGPRTEVTEDRSDQGPKWMYPRNKLITPMQSGFRKGRSTTDQLVRLETFVREAFIQKQHAAVIFIDLNTTWKYGILKDLHDAGL